MEIKEKLIQPYTNEERIDFIINQNHKNGYLIEKIEDGLIALGYTQEELEQFELDRIKNLTCTKRVFALLLQELGITYSQLKEIISTNEQAQLEWDLCTELQRSNPLFDLMAANLNISSETIDYIFKKANNEYFPENVGE